MTPTKEEKAVWFLEHISMTATWLADSVNLGWTKDPQKAKRFRTMVEAQEYDDDNTANGNELHCFPTEHIFIMKGAIEPTSKMNTPTKEELDEAIKYYDDDYKSIFPELRKYHETALSILTKYRDGELVEKEQWISVKEPHNLQSEDLVWTWNGQALNKSYFKSKDEFGMRFLHAGPFYHNLHDGAFHHTYNVTHYQSYTVPSPPTNQTEK